MNYTKPSQEEKKALHIAFVSVSSLTFEEINGTGKIDFIFQYKGNIYIDSNGNDINLTKEQRIYLAEWMSYSR